MAIRNGGTESVRWLALLFVAAGSRRPLTSATVSETVRVRRRKSRWPTREREVKAQKTFDDVVVPEAARLDLRISEASEQLGELRQLHRDRCDWLRVHPEATARLDVIEREMNPVSDMPEIHQELSRLLAPRHERGLHPGMEHGPDLGIDIGL